MDLGHSMNTEFWDIQEETGMGKKRPERDMVESALLENSRRKAFEIAEEIGLFNTMGYDDAVSYVRRIKKDMRKKGKIKVGALATDADRLRDVTTLFELRQGKMSSGAAYFMLLLNCYYRLRSEDDDVHLMAIDDTYEKNAYLENPLPMHEAIKLCEVALAQYVRSIDEDEIEKAKRRGYPGAGLNYTDERFIEKLEITEEELQHMESIER